MQSVDVPEGVDFYIGSLVLKGIVSPESLVNGTLTLLDLNYISNLVKYKETVHKAYNGLLERERELQRKRK